MVTLGAVLDLPLEHLRSASREVDSAGADAVWVVEAAHSAFVSATLAVDSTERARVGTAIAVAFPRSPTITAMTGMDLASLSQGRFVLGLATQVKKNVEDRFVSDFDPVIPRIQEYISTTRAVWATASGDPTTFVGDIYKLRRPELYAEPSRGVEVPPLYLGAVGRKMLHVAGRTADGVLGLPFASLRYINEVLVPTTLGALENAERSRRGFEVCVGVIVSISDDRDVAIREARQQVAFFGTTPNFRIVLQPHGDENLNDRLRILWRTGSFDRLAEELPERTLQRYAIAGRPDEVRHRFDDFMAGLDTEVDHLMISGPTYRVPAERRLENAKAVSNMIEHYRNPVRS